MITHYILFYSQTSQGSVIKCSNYRGSNYGAIEICSNYRKFELGRVELGGGGVACILLHDENGFRVINL